MLGAQADQIGARIGADPAQTQQAISAALPALLAGLQQEAARARAPAGDRGGPRRLHPRRHPRLSQRHRQPGSRTTDGNGILEHVLGDRQQPVAQALSSQTGLSSSTIMRLLPSSPRS